MKMKKFYGINPPMVTPFDDNDKVDISKVRALTDFLIEGGVNGLYPTGSTGEMDSMSVDERKQVAEAVVEQNNGRVTVFIHVGAFSLADTITLAKHAYDIGADGIGAVTPIYFRVNPREMEEYYTVTAHSQNCSQQIVRTLDNREITSVDFCIFCRFEHIRKAVFDANYVGCAFYQVFTDFRCQIVSG